MRIAKSAVNYLERKGLIPTRRSPVARMRLGDNIVLQTPLPPPLPLPPRAEDSNGCPPPDGGRTRVWPNGQLE